MSKNADVVIRLYAVAYPHTKIQNINNVIALQECESTTEVLSVIAGWRVEFPNRRYVYRREIEVKE